MINCGKKFTSDANVAPAPSSTKRAGKAQHISVDEEAKSEKIFAVLSFTVTSYIEII